MYVYETFLYERALSSRYFAIVILNTPKFTWDEKLRKFALFSDILLTCEM